MLETRDLTKVYKPKRGVPVVALNKVSIRFPDKGMVFLLGKSGSGKSTLLNLLGGLDRYDGGEIIIKGQSSKSFRQKHFDSYRNTYVGFIFQEYNILDEFSVGANIALAIQLQGRKATDDDINRILEEVDLAGYGNRKPNELSGGQKQRVAIARALVKNPRIIMADEPTGALDSVTGRQVLDTLKKLSADKLVIVVSHDREFAENYADRIIELADGQVIHDNEYLDDRTPVIEEETEETRSLVYTGNTVVIPEKYHLTLEDVTAINAHIDRLEKGEVTLTVSGEGKAKAGGRRMVPTDESKITVDRTGSFKLIKSRLPMRYAFKMGGSSLKNKKVRLVFTILLSCVAFGLFGLADSFGAYDYVTTCTNSLLDSEIRYASLSKAVKEYNDDGKHFYYSTYDNKISDKDIDTIREQTGLDVIGVFNDQVYGQGISISDYLGEQEMDENFVYDGGSRLYSREFCGYAEVNQKVLDNAHIRVVEGRLPVGNKKELVISSYMLETFKQNGFRDWDGVQNREEGKTEDDTITGEKPTEDYAPYQTVEIKSAADIIGKSLLGCTVVGVVDTGVDLKRYEQAFQININDTTADTLLKFALQQEFESLRQYSFACLAMVGEGFGAQMEDNRMESCMLEDNWHYLISKTDPNHNQWGSELLFYSENLSDMDILWLDEEKTELSGKEVLIPYDTAMNFYYSFGQTDRWDDEQEMTEEELIVEFLKENPFISLCKEVSYTPDGYPIVETVEEDLQIVGFTRESNSDMHRGIMVSKTVFEKHREDKGNKDGIYSFALTAMPSDKEAVRRVVAHGDDDTLDVRFELNNPVSYELGTLREVFETLSPIFLYIGLGFALFASLMMSNFISTSIIYKKREIGILRAIGSRGNDVFRIFFSESFIIAMINFVLTTAGLFAVTEFINYIIRSNTGLLITVLNFGPRQVLLEFGVSLLVAAVASFIPVKRIASKRPIDAIRDR